MTTIKPALACTEHGSHALRFDAATLALCAASAVGAAAAMIALYLGLLTLVSGWEFLIGELELYWPYIAALASGFGLQAGLVVYLRRIVAGAHGTTVIATSGGTSGAAMLSCCTHYLANLLPVLGATGLVGLIGEYQREIFWVGIAANAAGLLYIGNRVVAAVRGH